MSKSSAYDFPGLYASMLKDIEAYFPIDRKEWFRDLSRITLLAESRGTPSFTMDLPALGKALDASLARGRLDLSGLNHSGSRYPGSKIPRLFWGLWSRLFDSDGCLKHDIDPNVVVFLRGLLYVGKNLQMECAPRYLFETVKEFYDVESALPHPSPIWESDGSDLSRSDCGNLSDYHISHDDLFDLSPSGDSVIEAAMLDYVQQFADMVSGDIGFLDPESLQFRHGPGAVSDAQRGSYKYDFPYWSHRLETLFPYTSCGSTPLRWDGVDARTGVEIEFSELASRLIAVPKTQKGPRLIAAEPTCHQWIQQGIREHLYAYVQRESSLLNTSITFRDQSVSGELALAASKSGQFATVDLKSASDRLSTQLVQRIFRANLSLLGPMISSRTRFIVNRIDRAMPSLCKLRKFSTQGSALTFPIQSLVFAIISVGVGKSLHPHLSWRSLARRVRVFGDDIIVPVLWEPQLRKALSLLGLRVNDTKTFSVGFFRESCGTDGWMGYNVTPPHVSCVVEKSKARSIASNTAVSNNFYRKGWWNAASWLQRQLVNRNFRITGPYSGIFGFVSFAGPQIPTKKRWNKELQREEVQALQIFAKSRSTKQQTAGTLLEFMTCFREEAYRPREYGVKLPILETSELSDSIDISERGWNLNDPASGRTYGLDFDCEDPRNRNLRALTPKEYQSGIIQAGDPIVRVTWVPSTSLG